MAVLRLNGKKNRHFLIASWIVAAVWASPTLATTYFVDGAQLGGTCDDKNSGTIFEQPWCTISRAAAVVVPGDTVYIRQAVYREAVYLNKAGTSANQILFQRYGREIPTLTGTDSISGWTLDADQRYVASLAGSPVTTVVLENGIRLTAVASRAAVNTPGTWFHDAANNVLYVQTLSGAAPEAVTIEAARRSTVLNLTGSAYVIWDGIYVSGANSASGTNIYAKSGDHVTLKNIHVYAAGRDGINLSPAATMHNWLMERVVASHNTRNGIRIQNSLGSHSGMQVQRSLISHNGESGLWVEHGDNTIVERNRLYYNNPQSAAEANNDGATLKNITHPITRYNISAGNGGVGLSHRGGSAGEVYYNLAFGNGHHGFDLTSGGIGFQFYNNTSVNNGEAVDDHAFYYRSGGVSDANLTLMNNIFVGSAGRALTFDDVDGAVSGVISDYNLLYLESGAAADALVRLNGQNYTALADWQATGSTPDAHSLSVNPQWRNEAIHNYRLHSTSPAIDRGTTLNLVTDLAGHSVPGGAAPDLGAYEFVLSQITTARRSIIQ